MWCTIPPTYACVFIPVYGALMHEARLPGMFLCHIQSSVPSHGAAASVWCCWLHMASQHQLLFRWWHLLLVLSSDVTALLLPNAAYVLLTSTGLTRLAALETRRKRRREKLEHLTLLLTFEMLKQKPWQWNYYWLLFWKVGCLKAPLAGHNILSSEKRFFFF